MTIRQIFHLCASIGLVSLVLVSFNNCSEHKPIGSSLNSLGPATTIQSSSKEQYYSLQSGGQLAHSMASVTGVEITTGIVNEYNARKALMSDNYAITSMNAPMLVAITNLASQYCGELVNKESKLTAPQRRFFNDIDFTKGTAAHNSEKILKVTDKMATLMLGRKLEGEERQIFIDSYADFTATLTGGAATSNASTRALLLYNCSSILSSFDFVTI